MSRPEHVIVDELDPKEKGLTIGDYLKDNYRDKTIGKEAVPYIKPIVDSIGSAYTDTMRDARHGLLGPHSFVGAHALNLAGKVIPDIPIDKGIKHALHEWGGVDEYLSGVVGQGAEIGLTRKAFNKISKLKPKDLGITTKTEKINTLSRGKKMWNITDQIDEIIVKANPSYIRKASELYKHHEGGITWKQAMEMAKLPSWENRTVYIPPNERIGTQKGDPLQSTIDPVPPVVRRTMAWESGLKDGIFDFEIWKSKELRGKTYRSRLTASMIQTAHKEGVSFEVYRDNIVMPAFKKEWQPILKKLDINPSNLELHHIGAIKASVGLYDGLQYGSPEWNAVTEALLKRYVKLGDVPDNLIPVVGSRTDIGTPHYIAHKYLDDIVGPIGENFFTPERRALMKSSPAERINAVNDYADIVKKSEQIVIQAQEIWDLSYKGDIPESLVEKLMANPAIFDETYQPPQLRNMVQTAIDDLDLNPLEQGIPNALTDVLQRIDAGQNMILDLINNPKLTSRKAIQRYNIKDPRNKQLVLKLVKSVQNLTPQQVQRIMQEYGKGGKGGIPISYNIDDIFPV